MMGLLEILERSIREAHFCLGDRFLNIHDLGMSKHSRKKEKNSNMLHDGAH